MLNAVPLLHEEHSGYVWLHLPRELSGADGYSARAGALRRRGHRHCRGIPSPVRGRGKLTPPGTIDLRSSEIAPGTTSNAVAVS